MTYTDYIENNTIQQDVFIEIEYGINITDSLAIQSGVTYITAWPFDEADYSRQKDSSNPNIISVSNNILTVTLSNPPNSTYPVYAVKKMRLTAGQTKYRNKNDPTSVSSNPNLNREYKPLLLSIPSINQQITDVTTSDIVTSSSSITATTVSGFFDEYLDAGVGTFYNQKVTIYYGYEDEYFIAGEARIADISQSQTVITFKTKDRLVELKSQCLLGESNEYAYITSDDYTSVYPPDEGRPIITYFGMFSSCGKIETPASSGNFILDSSLTPKPPRHRMDLSTPVFTMGKVASVTAKTTYTPVSGSTSGFQPTANDLYFFVPGMYISVEAPALTWTTVIVKNIDYDIPYVYITTTLASSIVGVQVLDDVEFYIGNTNIIATSHIVSTDTSDNGSITYRLQPNSGLGYTNYEESHGIIITRTSQNHSDVLKFILESNGLTINAASFAAAKSALDADVMFSIPGIREDDYSDIMTYVKPILLSTFGYIFINSSDEYVYNLVDALGTPSIVITEDHILDRSLSIATNSQDIKSRYETTTTELQNLQTITSTDSDAGLEYLLSKVGIYKENSVLVTGQDSVKARLFEFLKAPKMVYNFKTTLKYIDIEIGDEITIESDKVAGGSVDLLVTGYSKTLNYVGITAIEVPL
jgi:hypothetical protein